MCVLTILYIPTVSTHCRVLYFPGYLEVLTLLEEQRGGWKDLHGHKLFRSLVRTHFVPSKNTSVLHSVLYLSPLMSYMLLANPFCCWIRGGLSTGWDREAPAGGPRRTVLPTPRHPSQTQPGELLCTLLLFATTTTLYYCCILIILFVLTLSHLCLLSTVVSLRARS